MFALRANKPGGGEAADYPATAWWGCAARAPEVANKLKLWYTEILKREVKQMKKSTLILLIITATMLVASGLGAWWVMKKNDNAKIAKVYQNDILLYEIDLSKVEKPYTIEIKGENEKLNVIEVRNGEIGVVSASCPDKLCVNMGFTGQSHLPVICLPNDIMITVDAKEESFDAKT